MNVFENAVIADLAALLGVERRAVEHDLRLVAARDRVDRLAVAQQRDHATIGFESFVAGKL